VGCINHRNGNRRSFTSEALPVLTALNRAAETLNSLPSDEDSGSETDPDSPVAGSRSRQPYSPFALDAREARLEAQEHHKFLLAKSFFDCREYDRCAAVFLPSTLPRIPASTATSSSVKSKYTNKGKERITSPLVAQPLNLSLSNVSQKALFLAIYAKYLAGEKRKDEDSEMILGPADGGVTTNKELTSLIGILGKWFEEREAMGRDGSGWLEYLYGILLAKNKSDDLAKVWFTKSVHLYPWNWGAWQELSNLLNNVEEVFFYPKSMTKGC
jgi:anaphase-promoting complex subunit 8